MVRAFAGEMARVVEVSEPVDGESNGARFVCVITGRLVDDDDVQVGLVVPAAQGAGPEEDGAIDGGSAIRSWQRAMAFGSGPA